MHKYNKFTKKKYEANMNYIIMNEIITIDVESLSIKIFNGNKFRFSNDFINFDI